MLKKGCVAQVNIAYPVAVNFKLVNTFHVKKSVVVEVQLPQIWIGRNIKLPQKIILKVCYCEFGIVRDI